MIAMISLAAKVAKADGSVTQAEVKSFDKFLKDQLGMAAEERRVAARIFNEARDSHIPAEDFARQIRAAHGPPARPPAGPDFAADEHRHGRRSASCRPRSD